ncbi:hypothetical protein LXL04_035409 [Taraxacum kok-saghyz]
MSTQQQGRRSGSEKEAGGSSDRRKMQGCRGREAAPGREAAIGGRCKVEGPISDGPIADARSDFRRADFRCRVEGRRLRPGALRSPSYLSLCLAMASAGNGFELLVEFEGKKQAADGFEGKRRE